MSSTPDTTITNSDVLAKYKAAGEILAKVLKEVEALAIPGASVFELCKHGDELLEEETSKIYNLKKNKVDKGIGFPTCVSPNNVAEYFSPNTAEDDVVLKEGDIVSIHLGAQIDGYVSAVSKTVSVGGPATGKKADAIAAAYYATEAAIRVISEENKNYDVTKTVANVAKEFGVVPLEGMLSYAQEQNKPLGDKEIILNPTEQQKSQVASLPFKVGDVFGLDILVSTGEGKAKPTDIKTTVYGLTGNLYLLKLKASHHALSEVKSKSAHFPINTRLFKDPKKGRMGLQECVNHGVMTAYDVVSEKPDEVIAQFFVTVGLTKNGIVKLAYPEVDLDQVKTEKKIENEELLSLLKRGLKKKKVAKK